MPGVRAFDGGVQRAETMGHPVPQPAGRCVGCPPAQVLNEVHMPAESFHVESVDAVDPDLISLPILVQESPVAALAREIYAASAVVETVAEPTIAGDDDEIVIQRFFSGEPEEGPDDLEKEE